MEGLKRMMDIMVVGGYDDSKGVELHKIVYSQYREM